MDEFDSIKARFESGNRIQIDKATVPKSEIDALAKRIEELEKDAKLLDWLGENFFNREMGNFDSVVLGRMGVQTMWVFFTPIEARGNLRELLHAAMEAQKP